MFWKSGREAFYAPPENCAQKVRFARHVDLVAPIDDRGLVFSDELRNNTPGATLKYIAVAPSGLALDPAGAVRIQENLVGTVAFVGATPPLLVYSAADASADATHLYVFGPVPF